MVIKEIYECPKGNSCLPYLEHFFSGNPNAVYTAALKFLVDFRPQAPNLKVLRIECDDNLLRAANQLAQKKVYLQALEDDAIFKNKFLERTLNGKEMDKLPDGLLIQVGKVQDELLANEQLIDKVTNELNSVLFHEPVLLQTKNMLHVCKDI